MKKIERILTIIPISLFMIWYLLAAYANVFACDDYWYGEQIHRIGFWGTQINYWWHWEGSFTNTFLASIPHIISLDKAPFLCNITSLVCLVLAVLFFLETYSTYTRRQALLASLYLVSVLYIVTNGGAEIRFWVSANNSYVVEISLAIVFLSLYHKDLSEFFSSRRIGIVVLALVLGGCKLTIVTFTIFGMIFHDLLYARRITKLSFVLFSALLISLIVNVLSPGNFVRLAEETSFKGAEKSMSIIDVVIDRLEHIWPIMLCTVALFPISTALKEKLRTNNKTIVIACGLWILFFLTDGIIMFLCFKDSGPQRIYFTVEFSIIAIAFFVIGAFKDNSKAWSKTVSVVVVFFLTIANFFFIKLLPPTFDYARQAVIRNLQVQNASNEDTLVLKRLPPSCLLLSYFSNDSTWIKEVYLPYFGKECEIELIND